MWICTHDGNLVNAEKLQCINIARNKNNRYEVVGWYGTDDCVVLAEYSTENNAKQAINEIFALIGKFNSSMPVYQD